MSITRASATEAGKHKRRIEAELRMKNELLKDILALLLLVGFAFLVNAGMRISGLYMDDLYMWSCWGEQSFFAYVFPFGSTRCRFVYWMAAWTELLLIGNHLEWIVPLNILLNALLGFFLYCFGKKLSHSRGVALGIGILFLASRFAYYQIGQLLGLMETMGVFFAAAMSMFLLDYMNHSGRKELFLSLGFYFLNCFTHERYMVLLPMFFFAFLMKKERKPLRWLLPVILFGAVQLLRLFFIGTLSPAGTGGTTVADTITLRGVLVNFLVELLYVFGINAGPEHLAGLTWQASPFALKILVLFENVLLLLLLGFLTASVIRRRKNGLPVLPVIRDAVFFFGFALGCAAASAVTIRVEMRWVYAVYVFKLLFIASLAGAFREERVMRQGRADTDSYRIMDYVPALIMIIMAVLTLFSEAACRKHQDKIYLFPNQKRYNSLADVTFGTYGKEILGKEIVIIGNYYEMSDFTAETFFKTFDPERTGQGTTVRHVEGITDLGQISDNMIVLKEDPAHDSFTDATAIVRSMKLDIEYGYYRDNWMDEEAHLRIMTGKSGEIRMTLTYPGNLTGTEVVTIRKDDEEQFTIPLSENQSEFVIHAEPYRIVDLRFSQNFYLPNAAEQRGEGRLSLLIGFTAE